MFRCISKCGRLFGSYYLTFAAAQEAAESFEIVFDCVVTIEVETPGGWVRAEYVQ